MNEHVDGALIHLEQRAVDDWRASCLLAGEGDTDYEYRASGRTFREAIEQRPVLSPDQRREIREAVRALWQGSINYNEPFIVDGLIEDIQRISQTGEEMSLEAEGENMKTGRRSFLGGLIGGIAGLFGTKAPAMAEDDSDLPPLDDEGDEPVEDEDEESSTSSPSSPSSELSTTAWTYSR